MSAKVYEVEEFGAACEATAGVVGVVPDGVFVDIEEILRMGIDDNFNNQATADGVSWPARKRIGDGHPLLDDTGALKAAAIGEGAGSVSRVVGGDELQIGVEKIELGGLMGTAVHQYGYPERNIPQREYLSISDDTADQAADLVLDRIFEEIFA